MPVVLSINDLLLNASLSSASSLQVRGPSRVPGLTVRRSLPVPMSWPATPAPTREKSASCARCVISASCAATTWSSTPVVILTSSPPCWAVTRAHPPLLARPSTIKMVWTGAGGVPAHWGRQEHRRSKWFLVNQLQSDQLIQHCCVGLQNVHIHTYTKQHTHRWMWWAPSSPPSQRSHVTPIHLLNITRVGCHELELVSNP